jgi:hypothetical protein
LIVAPSAAHWAADHLSDCHLARRFAKTTGVLVILSTIPRRQGTMANISCNSWTHRSAIVIFMGWIVLAMTFDPLSQAEAETAERDIFTEADAKRLPDNAEAMRTEIRRLQDSLGGPQVDQFPALREQGFGVPTAPARSRRAQSSIPRDAIHALRDAAAQLDTTANRLEQLELFTQADGLRQQAQHLRLDARRMSGPVAPTEPSLQPTPAQWFNPDPRHSPDWNRSMPQLRPSPEPRRARLAQPGLDSPPALEPVPQPEIPSDPPKPQPLLDSPEATPQPDVEVEG